MPNHMALNAVQLSTAHRLARAFGHSWAIDETLKLRSPVTPEQIETALRKATPPDEKLGIVRPVLDEHGYVTHTTGTGRTQWVVFRDGSAMLEIHRPKGLVLRAVVVRQGHTSMARQEVCFVRHWDALREAVRAAGGNEEAVRTAAPTLINKAWVVCDAAKARATSAGLSYLDPAWSEMEAFCQSQRDLIDRVIARSMEPLPPRTAAQRHAEGR